MSVGKTNPMRQMMINMMYLVLTALLALNVSAEILKAFETINKGVVKTVLLIDSKNKGTMTQFDKLAKSSPGAVGDLMDKARETNKLADDFYNYIERYKIEIYKLDEWDPKTMTLKNPSDLENPARIFIEEGKGEEIEKKILETRAKFFKIISTVKQIDIKKFEPNITLKIEKPDEAGVKWSYETFHMVPSAAVLCLLSKIQQDCRTTQANIIDALINAIGADEVSFDQLTAVVKSTKSSVSVGEKFSAEVFLAAYDSKQSPDIIIAGKPYPVTEGKTLFEGSTGSQGSFNIPGKIVVRNKKTGDTKEYPFSIDYDVFTAPAIISADAMKVLYIGLENPLSISVPGFKPSDVKATISNGTLKQVKPGEYIAVIPQPTGAPQPVKIQVSVTMPGGGGKSFPPQEFRVKRVPKPAPYFGQKEGGEITAAEVKMTNFVLVKLENFVFENIKYTVTKFRMVYVPKNGPADMADANGAQLTPKMKTMLANPKPGDMIIITGIEASSPALGNIKLGAGINLTVK